MGEKAKKNKKSKKNKSNEENRSSVRNLWIGAAITIVTATTATVVDHIDERLALQESQPAQCLAIAEHLVETADKDPEALRILLDSDFDLADGDDVCKGWRSFGEGLLLDEPPTSDEVDGEPPDSATG